MNLVYTSSQWVWSITFINIRFRWSFVVSLSWTITRIRYVIISGYIVGTFQIMSTRHHHMIGYDDDLGGLSWYVLTTKLQPCYNRVLHSDLERTIPLTLFVSNTRKKIPEHRMSSTPQVMIVMYSNLTGENKVLDHGGVPRSWTNTLLTNGCVFFGQTYCAYCTTSSRYSSEYC